MRLVVCLLTLFSGVLSAGEKVPLLTGTLKISVTNGTIDSDFVLKDIPKIKNYVILLNTGFNIEYFRNQAKHYNYSFKKNYSKNSFSDNFSYYFPDSSGKGKFIPDTLQLKYTGKFPVIDDLTNTDDYSDWKGNIAFNGKTIRTDGSQTGWYPVLYDIEKDKSYYKLRYDIEVICNDCQSIYVNGSEPVSGAKGHFTSEKPTEIALFAGQYQFERQDGNFYLNSGLTKQQIKELSHLTNTYQQYYEKMLSISYDDSIAYIQTTPVSKKIAWMFVSYPAIVSIGHGDNGLKGLFKEENARDNKLFIAHELAHYYFANFRQFNSELGDMIIESFSEFLALKVAQNFLGENVYVNAIEKKMAELADNQFTPIKSIESPKDYGNRNSYVYTYGPVVLVAIEKEIGEKNMFLWMNKILSTEAERTDYEFIVKMLGEVLKDNSQLEFLTKTYFSGDDVLANTTRILNIK